VGGDNAPCDRKRVTLAAPGAGDASPPRDGRRGRRAADVAAELDGVVMTQAGPLGRDETRTNRRLGSPC